ncbi:MAG: hypothetical protein ACT4O3_08390 [Elusimicrobiota bacterium]
MRSGRAGTTPGRSPPANFERAGGGRGLVPGRLAAGRAVREEGRVARRGRRRALPRGGRRGRDGRAPRGERGEDYRSEERNRRRPFTIDVARSGTRKEELLMEPGELEAVRKLRRILSSMQPPEAAQQLVNELQHYPTNKEFLAAVAKA